MRLAWSSDLHLKFASLKAWENWLKQIQDSGSDGLILTGDISESTDLLFQLDRIRFAVDLPIYFVLGNHDYYDGSVRGVRSIVRQHCRNDRSLTYLSGSAGIPLDSSWTLIGHDGWGDAALGDFDRSPVRLIDFTKIKDFHGLTKGVLYERLRELGRDAAETLRAELLSALKQERNLLIATHVPPFAESCWYEGRNSDPDWLPFFSCGAMGEMLLSAAKEYPKRSFIVLCGHTHHSGIAHICENLTVLTASAEYGSPSLFEVIDTERLKFLDSTG